MEETWCSPMTSVLGREERSFGPSYFALDITTPDNPQLLWEFTHPSLGFTTAYPAVIRVEADPGTNQPEDDKWFVLFGSGPTDYGGMSNQPASMFVVDLKTGELERIFEEEGSTGFMSGAISIDYNLNYNTDIMYSGSSMLFEGQWRGAIYRLSTRTCTGVTAVMRTGGTIPPILTTGPFQNSLVHHNQLPPRLMPPSMKTTTCGFTVAQEDTTDFPIGSDHDLQNQFFGTKRSLLPG